MHPTRRRLSSASSARARPVPSAHATAASAFRRPHPGLASPPQPRCGSLLAPMMRPPDGGGDRDGAVCRMCGEGKGEVDVVTMPYVFQYLTNELAAMNISTKLTVKSAEQGR